MEGFKRILYPVSLTEASPKIAPYVSLMAKRFEAEIHLLYVAQELERYRGIHAKPSLIDEFSNELIKGAQDRLKQFSGEFSRDFPDIKTAVVSGDRAKEILASL